MRSDAGSHALQPSGSAPSAIRTFVGRAEDLLKIRRRLVPDTTDQDTVRFDPQILREAFEQSGLTLKQLADSESTAKNALAGKPVRRTTANIIAKNVSKDRGDLLPAEPSQRLLVVRGLAGVGKTTLTRAAAYDPFLNKAFPDGVLWCSLGEKPLLLPLLRAWARSLAFEGIEKEEDIGQARAVLNRFLSQKRVLVIIDDAWSTVDAMTLAIGGPRCSILVTTRDREVALDLAPDAESRHELGVLSEGDSHAVGEVGSKSGSRASWCCSQVGS